MSLIQTEVMETVNEAEKRIAKLEAENARMQAVVDAAKKWGSFHGKGSAMKFLDACDELEAALSALEDGK